MFKFCGAWVLDREKLVPYLSSQFSLILIPVMCLECCAYSFLLDINVIWTMALLGCLFYILLYLPGTGLQILLVSHAKPCSSPFLSISPVPGPGWDAMCLEARGFLITAVYVKMGYINSHKQEPPPYQSPRRMPQAREPCCFLHMDFCILSCI